MIFALFPWCSLKLSLDRVNPFWKKTTNDFMVFGEDQFFGKNNLTHMICGLFFGDV